MTNHLGDTNKMVSDTPRTEAEVNRPHGPLDGVVTVDADFSAQLERELNAANERIKRLEEAGDMLSAAAAFIGWHLEIEVWRKAKESKP